MGFQSNPFLTADVEEREDFDIRVAEGTVRGVRSASMRELAPGLWHWTATHPEWTAEDDDAGHLWGPGVSSYAVRHGDGGRLTLIDPVLPDGGIDALTADRREVSVVLTCPWHRRDSAGLGFPIHAPACGDDRVEGATPYAAGDTPVPGIEALPGLEPADLVLWIAEHRALVFGDTLVDLGRGLELPDDWGPSQIDHHPVLERLRGALDLEPHLALPTHGAPSDRRGLRAALAHRAP